ncbi:MAG TPA: hypothetical protein VNK82_12245 [Terriglobales bacterium]|nr:hypothetical protein [Terriglobales bacterium]
MDVRELLRSSKVEGSFGGLRLTLDADGGLIQVAHIVYDEATGYSAIVKPFDRGAPTDIAEQQYVAAMVALASPDPALALPDKTELVPEVLLRNASASALGITLTASWRDGDQWGIADLGQVQLGANETRSVNLSKYQQDGVIPRSARWAAVRLNYRGARGDLVAVSATHDPAFRYVLQSPFTDALSFSWRGSMWSVDSTHNSLITTGNAGDKPARVKATLRHALGSYELPEQTLQPGESIWLNLRELIQNQIPDREGNVIPLNVTSGVYEFDQVDDDMIGFLYEGKLILDSTYGRATYGCANCCGYDALGLSPNPLGIDVGFTSQDRIYVENACTGAITERTTYGYNWLTGSSSIAGISSSGLVSAISPGQTWSSAFISLRTPGVPFCPQQVQEVDNTVNSKPRISGPNTVWWFNSATPSGYATAITLTSSGGSATSWQVTAGATKVTLSSTAGSQITVSSSGTAFSSSPGDIIITASANGQTSLPFAMTTRKPYRLTSPQTVHECDSNFGYADHISYVIQDQLTTNVPSALPWNEKFTSACVQDNAQGNWCSYGLPDEVGDVGTILVDNITGPGINNSPPPNPTPVCVGDSTKQQHWGQEFRVGSLTPGLGVRVQTNTFVRFTNHAEHQAIVSPAP